MLSMLAGIFIAYGTHLPARPDMVKAARHEGLLWQAPGLIVYRLWRELLPVF
jgi:hypothetical protein